jgi:hypothetical protein
MMQLYDFRNYRRRTLAFLLHRGRMVSRAKFGAADVRLLGRVLWRTLLRTRPRRAWFTLSLLVATLLRRPSALKDALYFVTVHKGLYEYMESLGEHLDVAIRDLAARQADAQVRIPA